MLTDYNESHDTLSEMRKSVDADDGASNIWDTGRFLKLSADMEHDDPEHAPDPVPVFKDVFTVDQLLEIVRSNPDPEIRVMAADLLYKTGKRDQAHAAVTARVAA